MQLYSPVPLSPVLIVVKYRTLLRFQIVIPNRQQLVQEGKELCASGGSVLFSSHILDVVEKTCNKIAIIRNGELIRSGETKEILGNRDLENVFMELNGK